MKRIIQPPHLYLAQPGTQAQLLRRRARHILKRLTRQPHQPISRKTTRTRGTHPEIRPEGDDIRLIDPLDARQHARQLARIVPVRTLLEHVGRLVFKGFVRREVRCGFVRPVREGLVTTGWRGRRGTYVQAVMTVISLMRQIFVISRMGSWCSLWHGTGSLALRAFTQIGETYDITHEK